MQVTIKFSDTISSTVDIATAWELYYLYQQGVRIANETVTAERKVKWQQVELELQNANEGDTIDFSVMGEIYFENGKAGFKE